MQYTYDNFNIKKNFVFWSGQLARDARPMEPTNLKSVGLPYLDNQLQQVASLLQESQIFVLCSFTKFAFGQGAAVYIETMNQGPLQSKISHWPKV